MRAAAAVKRDTRALFDVAERTGDADRVAAELDALAAAIGGDAEVARAFAAGATMTTAQRVDVVRALVSQLGFSDIVGKLLVMLAERDQLGLVPDLAEGFRARLLDRRNVVRAEVTTAVALPADRVGALARRLGEVTGKDVQLSARVDPSIIGGAVTRIGSLVYDGSVTGQLARIRQKLVENV